MRYGIERMHSDGIWKPETCRPCWPKSEPAQAVVDRLNGVHGGIYRVGVKVK